MQWQYSDILIYCIWVSTRWQLSVNLNKNSRQLYTEGETIHKTIQKHRIRKIENIQNKKKSILKTINLVLICGNKMPTRCNRGF